MQAYIFVLKHHAGVENYTTDFLSRHHILLSTISTEVISFDKIKEDNEYPNFGSILTTLYKGPSRKYSEYILQNGYLFRGTRLCVPNTSLRDFLV